MSRTYRKTRTKQGHPRSWGYRSMARKSMHDTSKPQPYTVPSGLYQRVTEQRVIQYDRYCCPENERIYVTKGTPQAIQELDIYWRATGRYYLVPPPKTVERTFRKYLGPNPEFNWEERYKVWEQERIFDHVHRNRTGRRGSGKQFQKRSDRRASRREHKPDIRCPELIYPYLNKTSWYIKGSYLSFDYEDEDDWEDDYDWYCDMLEEYWAYQYDDEPDNDYYEDPYEYDYDPWDYDYDY